MGALASLSNTVKRQVQPETLNPIWALEYLDPERQEAHSARLEPKLSSILNARNRENPNNTRSFRLPEPSGGNKEKREIPNPRPETWGRAVGCGVWCRAVGLVLQSVKSSISHQPLTQTLGLGFNLLDEGVLIPKEWNKGRTGRPRSKTEPRA